MPRAKILIISFSPISTDPRVRRQIQLLKDEHALTVVGYGAFQEKGVEFVTVSRLSRTTRERLVAAFRLKTRRYEAFYWSDEAARRTRETLRCRKFDLILANDADAWPVAFALAGSGNTPVLCDAHEYAPLEFEDIRWWRFLFKPYRHDLCRRCLPRAAGVLTVCDGIADEYAREFGIRRPSVIRNMPSGAEAAPSATQPDLVRLIHHGAAMPSRNIETMIEMMRHLDGRFRLDLMLVGGDTPYLRHLRRLAARFDRIRFLDPVAPDQIITATQAYDVGLFLLPPVNFNYLHALPNKFFEFVQARLAVAIGPSPEMARLVREHHLGVVAEDFSPLALAASLNALTADRIAAFKAASHRAAAILRWEHDREILRAEINRVLQSIPCVA